MTLITTFSLPLANMYFTLYGYQTYTLTLNLLRDLKLVCLIRISCCFLRQLPSQGQYTGLPPRATFTVQAIGGVIVCY
jgi:hypothetical protein